MKKNYLLVLGLLISASVSAQVGGKNFPKKIEKSFSTHIVKSTESQLITPKVGGDIVWDSDFSDPTDWTIDNDGQTAAGFGWDIGATESSWWTSALINSTSGGNFAELGNGVPQSSTQALDVVYTLTNAVAIPITTNALTLNFLQYGARFNDAQEMYISTNGTDWVLAGDNSDFAVLSQSGGSAYPNPSQKSINLVNLVAPTATELWVRFQWTTAYPAQASNPNAWVTYGWFIDDVSIVETYENDLVLNDFIWGADNGTEVLPYFQTPLAQVQPIVFGGDITNAGSLAKTDVVFKANITAQSFAGVSAASTLAAYENGVIYTTTDFTPSATGSYTVSGVEVESALDDLPGNNTASDVTFETTNFTYARDNGMQDGNGDNQKDPFELCNQFDVYANANLMGIDAFIDATASTGSIVYVNIRDISTAALDVLDQSNDYTLLAGDKNKFITVKFQQPYALTANTSYLACIGSYGGVGTTDLVVGNAGYSQDQTTFLYDGGAAAEWYFTNSTVMVRMNFDPSLGVEETSNDFITLSNVYPNPSTGVTSVDFSLTNASDVSIQIVDLTGKEVFVANYGSLLGGVNTVSFDATSFEAGIYYVNVLTNGTQVTKKLIKN